VTEKAMVLSAGLVVAAAAALSLGARSGAQGESAAVPASPAGPPPEKGYVRPSDDELRKRLTPLQFEVTRREATERPFANAYWDNHRPGIYVDVVSGEPLFSSLDKFESGTGWPSFTRPLEKKNVRTRTDYVLMVPRTEVRSRLADSHLGHVFDDGPPPTGQRYCMNSASLRFVPVEELAAQGYGQYLPLFEKAGKKP
jgi:methionine-R-sulfoxide reductase